MHSRRVTWQSNFWNLLPIVKNVTGVDGGEGAGLAVAAASAAATGRRQTCGGVGESVKEEGKRFRRW